MPHLTNSHPVASGRLARHNRVASRFPVANRLVQDIRSKLDVHKFGDSDSEIDLKYRFLNLIPGSRFLKAHLECRSTQEVDLDFLANAVARTLNVRQPGEEDLSTIQLFRARATSMVEEIIENRGSSTPIIDIVIGPTGAGKTSFSKGLFTASSSIFLGQRIIPTRLEFTKFFSPAEPFTEENLVTALKQCMARDFMILSLFSGDKSINWPSIRERITGDQKLRNCIADLIKLSEANTIGSGEFTLGQAFKLWRDTVNYFEEQSVLDMVLGVAAEEGFEFFVSLDGFDIVRTEEFLISDSHSVPIDAAVSLLRDVSAKAAIGELKSLSSITRYALYVRDTTFSRLRIELDRRPGGNNELDPLWIVPPSYSEMVQKVVDLVHFEYETAPTGPNSELTDFSAQMEDSLVRSLLPIVQAENASAPLEAAFAYNARNMKRQIIRNLIWCMEIILQKDDEFVERIKRGAGIGPAVFWQRVIDSDFFSEAKNYQIIEELFLDETHQFRPQFLFSAEQLETALSEGNVVGAIQCLRDYDETNGFVDNALNYLTRDILFEDEKKCVPALLVMFRVIQFVSIRKWTDFRDIELHLSKLGYSISECRLKFFVYVLLRDEFIRIGVDDDEVSEIQDCHFSLSSFGPLVLHRLFFSVAYVGEAMMIAQLPREGLRQVLRGRGSPQKKEEWLLSVAINSLVFLNFLSEIEKVEKENYGDNQAFSKISVLQTAKERVVREIDAISGASNPEARSVARELAPSIRNIQDEFPDFINFFELEN